jgi:NADH-quinone oxidoreductase subunit N
MTPSLPLSSLTALLPLIALIGTAVVIALATLWIDAWRFSAWLSVTALVVVIALVLLVVLSGSSTIIEGMINVDWRSAVFALYFCGAGGAVAFLELGEGTSTQGARYVLLLLAVTGGMIVAQSIHLLPLVTGLFTMYLACDAMSGPRPAPGRFAAHALSLACLLLGASVVYGASGTLRIDVPAPTLGELVPDTANPLVALGTGILIAGLALPLGLIPFHALSYHVHTHPDARRSILSALIQPAAALSALSRMHNTWTAGTNTALITLAALSIVYGLWTSLRARPLSQVIYGIASLQAGELVLCTELMPVADPTLLLYSLLAHGPILACLWATLVNTRRPSREQLLVGDLDGLAGRRPWLAATLTICLLSLAAVPPFAGAATRLYLGQAAVASDHLWLVGLLALDVFGCWLLLGRFLVGMWLRPRTDRLWYPSTPEVAAIASISATAVLALGLYAQAVISWLYYLIGAGP